jgi:hypothetical protein
VGFLLAGGERFASRTGMTIIGVLFFYLVIGPVLGGIVGLLRPLANSTPGTMLIGLVCGVVVGLVGAVGFAGLPWTSNHTLMVKTFGGAAALGALLMRHNLRRR